MSKSGQKIEKQLNFFKIFKNFKEKQGIKIPLKIKTKFNKVFNTKIKQLLIYKMNCFLFVKKATTKIPLKMLIDSTTYVFSMIKKSQKGSNILHQYKGMNLKQK